MSHWVSQSVTKVGLELLARAAKNLFARFCDIWWNKIMCNGRIVIMQQSFWLGEVVKNFLIEGAAMVMVMMTLYLQRYSRLLFIYKDIQDNGELEPIKGTQIQGWETCGLIYILYCLTGASHFSYGRTDGRSDGRTEVLQKVLTEKRARLFSVLS